MKYQESFEKASQIIDEEFDIRDAKFDGVDLQDEIQNNIVQIFASHNIEALRHYLVSDDEKKTGMIEKYIRLHMQKHSFQETVDEFQSYVDEYELDDVEVTYGTGSAKDAKKAVESVEDYARRDKEEMWYAGGSRKASISFVARNQFTGKQELDEPDIVDNDDPRQEYTHREEVLLKLIRDNSDVLVKKAVDTDELIHFIRTEYPEQYKYALTWTLLYRIILESEYYENIKERYEADTKEDIFRRYLNGDIDYKEFWIMRKDIHELTRQYFESREVEERVDVVDSYVEKLLK